MVILVFFGESEAGKIESCLDELVALVENHEAEARLPTLPRRGKSAVSSQDCEVQLLAGELAIKGRKTLTGPVFKLRSDMEKISMSLHDRSVEVESVDDTVSMPLRAWARLQLQSNTVRDEQRFIFDWVNSNGQWLIAR